MKQHYFYIHLYKKTHYNCFNPPLCAFVIDIIDWSYVLYQRKEDYTFKIVFEQSVRNEARIQVFWLNIKAAFVTSKKSGTKITNRNHTQQLLNHQPNYFPNICQSTIFNHTTTLNIIKVSKYSPSIEKVIIRHE